MSTWLVIDAHYLCHRAFYTMGELSFGEIKTGVIYGFLRTISDLKDSFGTDKVVFCFDSKGSKRKELFKPYKERRHTKELTPEEQKAVAEFRKQISKLRDQYLPAIGYRNVFHVDGLESDDLIASVVRNSIGENDDAVIISADRDLWQLLDERVIMHNPDKRQTVTAASFSKEHGIPPAWWGRVLSLAGCKTDEVPGIPGIGKKTALSYLKGALKPTSKKYADIKSDAGRKVVKRNKRLVILPFDGTPEFSLQKDALSMEGWQAVCAELGLKSIRDRGPFSTREQRKQRPGGFGFDK